MRKYLKIFLPIALIFVAACSTASNEESSEIDEVTLESTEAVAEPTATPTPITSEENPCVAFNLIDEVILSSVNNNVAPVTETDLAYGPQDAKYTFITYSNFTCSYCALLEPILEELQAMYPEDVRVVFRYVTNSDVSILAAKAAEAANIQGKFSEMKDVLFDNQATWYYFSDDEFRTWLDEQATSFDMDVEQFNADLDSEEIDNLITSNRANVDKVGIVGTPTLFVNNRSYTQSRSLSLFAIMISVMENSDSELGSCPTIDTNLTGDLQAVISTDKGDIVVDLYEDEAPYAVAYFKYLAENGWYDNNQIFISTDEYVISGDPTNTSYGGPGFVFYSEVSENQTLDEEGLLVSFNRLGTGYNSGLFMLTKSAVADFSGEFTIFGKVTEGMDILQNMTERAFYIDPSEPFFDSITTITIQEK